MTQYHKNGFHLISFFHHKILSTNKLILFFSCYLSNLEITKRIIDKSSLRSIKDKPEPREIDIKWIQIMKSLMNRRKHLTMPNNMVMTYSNNNLSKMTTNLAFLISKFLKFYGEEFDKVRNNANI
jgi:hypothetical protein